MNYKLQRKEYSTINFSNLTKINDLSTIEIKKKKKMMKRKEDKKEEKKMYKYADKDV